MANYVCTKLAIREVNRDDQTFSVDISYYPEGSPSLVTTQRLEHLDMNAYPDIYNNDLLPLSATFI